MSNWSVLDKPKQQYPGGVLEKKVSLRPSTLLKKDSDIGVFQSIVRIFLNNFFERTPPVTAS